MSVGRKIIHVDMDAFFASVEQRDDPALRGRPVAVGSGKARGVVAAASYEARRFGVRSAMPSLVAARQCPDLVFVPPRFDVYREVSGQIRQIFLAYTALVEPLSLDEAYLDVTENIPGIASATTIAEEIRAKILARTGLTASAGVSCNKFLAKMASGVNKPDGLFVIRPQDGAAFVADLPVGRFHGIGPATAAKMEALGIRTGADLRRQSLASLQQRFGKSGEHFHSICRGIDERPVRPDRERKSIGAERTFETDLDDVDAMREMIEPVVGKVWERCEALDRQGRTVTLKVKYADFEQVTRAHSRARPYASASDILDEVGRLLRGLAPFDRPVRLLGVSVSSFGGGERRDEPQMSFAL